MKVLMVKSYNTVSVFFNTSIAIKVSEITEMLLECSIILFGY